MDTVALMFWSFPIYLIVQGMAAAKLRGIWRIACWVPVPLILCVLGYTIWAISEGSNLWPLVLLFTAPFALAYVVLVLALYGVAQLIAKRPRSH